MKRTICIMSLAILALFTSCVQKTDEDQKDKVYIANDSIVKAYRLESIGVQVPTGPQHMLVWVIDSMVVEQPTGIPMVVDGNQARYVNGIYIRKNGKYIAKSSACLVVPAGSRRAKIILIEYQDGKISSKPATANDLFSFDRSDYKKVYNLVNRKEPGIIIR